MKKSLLSLTVFLITSLVSVFAQPALELIITWSNEDTSTTGLKALEDNYGNLFILSDIDWFEKSSVNGIPIEGPFSLGTGITKISESGQKIWSYLYPTQNVVKRGKAPATSFMMNSNDEIVLPYTSYEGFLFCYSIGDAVFASESDKKAVMSIDPKRGGIIHNEQYVNDYLCDWDKMEGIKETEWGYVLLYHNSIDDILYIETLNHNFEVTDISAYPTYREMAVLSEFEDKVFILSSKSISVLDYDANVVENYNIDVEDEIIASPNSYAENENYHVVGMGGIDYNSSSSISILYLFDKQGSILSEKLYSDKLIRDVEISESNQILVLFDLSKSKYDSIPKPVRVSQYDIDLNHIASGDYGFPYIHTGDISLTNDQKGFMVTGTRLTSIIDAEHGREADQVYFLKGQLSDLIVSNENITQNSIDIKVFPNPTSDFLTINIVDNSISFDKINYTLMDSYGREVENGVIPNKLSNIAIKGLPSGIYYLKIWSNQEVWSVQKIFISKDS